MLSQAQNILATDSTDDGLDTDMAQRPLSPNLQHVAIRFGALWKKTFPTSD